ncbi:three-Cys-motif partner protein TcmP [Sphingorhabdus contaminans]|uniref:Three-Cys-motif partner protein TcmP n=1 Tax=Sphingorhabdus contaminans TaxID=1343899 RepID=A0A553WAB1_9SPHN|nr:three-Cys-motif partner protein TcmP [Sphingorhabdus contaminans]TSB01616.1 three-Cys-motif partner protein TcmP [Sphingorhabdus contaminans]
MPEKEYKWVEGATLDDHSKRKHKILREYFSNYLTVRCQIPQMNRFRLAVVDGFAGGGRYKCGAAGSPLIFAEELKRSLEAVNLKRSVQGLGQIDMECLLIVNDFSRDAIETLKANLAPIQAEIKSEVPKLHLRVEYLNDAFETAYSTIHQLLTDGSYHNVIFNLDQCGHSKVNHSTLTQIMRSYRSVEIFYTFMITSLLTYLQANDPKKLAAQLRPFEISVEEIQTQTIGMNKQQWLGAAERIVFESFNGCAKYVSPFSINNPEGWRYWLIHLANSHRARQVYNDLLHNNSSEQAHFGRSGLNMLSYDPRHDSGALYLFDISGRASALDRLMTDIPRLVSEFGNVVPVGEFYEGIYNATPAHSEDIHRAIIDNPDLEVVTPTGGERRSVKTISVGDIIQLKRQTSFFPVFFDKQF